jgi:hypothetical protein
MLPGPPVLGSSSCCTATSQTVPAVLPEVVPGLVEVEVAVPPPEPASR